MKFPEDKQERMKWFVVIGMGVVGIIFCIVYFGIIPFRKSIDDKKAKIAQLKEDIKAADGEIRKVEKDAAENRETLRKILDISSKYLLHPELGNYKLGAGRFSERCAKAAAVELKDPPRQIGFVEVAQGSFKAYGTHLALTESYDNLIALIRSLETNNPYLAVITIGIYGQTETDPEKHVLTVDFQLPVWMDFKAPANLEKQLQDMEPKEETKPPEKPSHEKK